MAKHISYYNRETGFDKNADIDLVAKTMETYTEEGGIKGTFRRKYQ